ncbi:hypothetical protein Tco_0602303 [Tanacetum coccineum]
MTFEISLCKCGLVHLSAVPFHESRHVSSLCKKEWSKQAQELMVFPLQVVVSTSFVSSQLLVVTAAQCCWWKDYNCLKTFYRQEDKDELKRKRLFREQKRNYQEESFTHKEDMAPIASLDSETYQARSVYYVREFQRARYKVYGPEKSKQESNVVCDNKSDNSKENSDESLVEEQVSQDKSSFVESSLNVDKETVFPVNKKGNPETDLKDSMRLNSPEDKKVLKSRFQVKAYANAAISSFC